MSPTRLSQIVLRPTGGMTQILDRLQREGLVRRSPDAADRRKIIVALTDKGVALAARANDRYAEARTELFGSLDDEQMAAIDAALHQLLAAFADLDSVLAPG